MDVQRDHDAAAEPREHPRRVAALAQPTPADAVLALQAGAGNQAVTRALRDGWRPGARVARAPGPAAPTAEGAGPELSELDLEFMRRDVDDIVALLQEQHLSAREEAEIVGRVRRWAELDRRHNEQGHPGTVNLDKFLLLLKTRAFVRRTARSGWIEQHMLAYDTIWHELEDGRRAEFAALVARSQKQGTTGPASGPSENLWATLGKQEAMGVWGILKGMGLTLSGAADAAIWLAWKQSGEPLGKVLEQQGVKDAAKAPALSPYLSKSYDEVARLLGDAMGVDPTKDATLLGQSSYEIGEFGGKIVGALTTAGVAGGGAGAQAQNVAKVLAVVGSVKSIEEGADAIAKRMEALQKRKPPPTLGQMLLDEAILVELAGILGNALGAASGAADAAPVLKAAFDRFGLIVDAAQLVPAVGKAFMHWNDPELAKDPEARAAALRDDVAGLVGSILSTAGTKGQEALDNRAAAEKAAQNKAFDERWNAHLAKPDAPPAAGAAAPVATPDPAAPAAPAHSQEQLSEFNMGEGYDYASMEGSHPQTYTGLQQRALATFGGDGPEAMVKVVPAGYDARPQDGYVTKLKYVQGRTPEQLAQTLGAKKFEQGVRVLHLDVGAVTPEMLHLRGYTQSPGGKDPSLSTTLAEYPVGSGAPQWEIQGAKVPVVADLGVVKPGEAFRP